MFRRYFITLAASALALGAAQAREPILSATKLTFGDATTLFVADWRGARIHALTLPVAAQGTGKAFNLKDVQAPIARALRVVPARLRFEDMASQPGSERVFVSLSVSDGRGGARPALVAIDADGKVLVVDLQHLPATSAQIDDEPSPDVKFWRDIPAQSVTVTDMTVHDHKLYVAGLSNRQFASTLRVYDLPLRGGARVTTVEMYHPVHNEIETRAPIRTLRVVPVGGVPTLVAAFTCTPLVAIPLTDLKDGAHIVAKTIGELGWGSEPIDMVSFSAGGSDFVLIANSSRAADLIPLSEIAEGMKKPGITTPIKWPTEPLAGVKAIMAPLSAVTQLDNLNDGLLVALRRDDASGAMQLVSIPKGAYLRVSDFINEYDFPGFEYQPHDPFREAHKYFYKVEGFPERIRD
jgi:hypothetical protein